MGIREYEEYHEHPYFNGQYHRAVWVKTWASNKTDNEPPLDAPIVCAICGKNMDNPHLEVEE